MHTRRLWHSIFLYVIYPARERSYICINVYPSTRPALFFSLSLTVSPSHASTQLSSLRFSLMLHLARFNLSFPFIFLPLFLCSFTLYFTNVLTLLIRSDILHERLHETPLWISTLCSVSLLYVILSNSVTSARMYIIDVISTFLYIIHIYIHIYTCIYVTVCVSLHIPADKNSQPSRVKLTQNKKRQRNKKKQ